MANKFSSAAKEITGGSQVIAGLDNQWRGSDHQRRR